MHNQDWYAVACIYHHASTVHTVINVNMLLQSSLSHSRYIITLDACRIEPWSPDAHLGVCGRISSAIGLFGIWFKMVQNTGGTSNVEFFCLVSIYFQEARFQSLY